MDHIPNYMHWGTHPHHPPKTVDTALEPNDLMPDQQIPVLVKEYYG